MSGEDIERPKLGEYFKRQRLLSGRTQRNIGRSALSTSYLSQIENNVISDVSVSKLFKLAEAYDVPIVSILSDVYGYEIGAAEAVATQALAIG